MRALFVGILWTVVACTPQVTEPTPVATVAPDARELGSRQQPSVVPQRAASARPETSTPPGPSAAPSVSAASASARPLGLSIQIPGVEVGSTKDLKGEVVYAARVVDEPRVSGRWSRFGSHQLWAIPISDGSAARVVLSYPRSPFTDAWPPRYVSPDGRRVAFEADRGDGVYRLAIADLLTGDLRWISTDSTEMHDRQPVWDPTGARLAFVRVTYDLGDLTNWRDEGAWVVDADGTDLRQVAAGVAATTYVYHWTPDGRHIAVAQNIGYDLIDVSTAERTAMERVVSGDASWRVAPPRLVARGWEGGSDEDRSYIFTAERADGPRTVLVRSSSTSELFSNPRWRPGRDEILYISGSVLRARDLGGVDRVLSERRVISPAWTSDGSAVVYIHPEEMTEPSPPPCPPGSVVCGGNVTFSVTTELRIVNADGTADRTLFRLPATGLHTSGWCVCNDGLTVRRY